MNSFGKPTKNNDLAKVLTHLDAAYEQVSMLVQRVECQAKDNYNLVKENERLLLQIAAMQQQIFESVNEIRSVTNHQNESIIGTETK